MMTKYRADCQKGRQLGRPKELPLVCRDGVRTRMVVEEMVREGGGWGGLTETIKSKIIKVDSRSLRGSPSPTRTPLYPPLLSTNIYTCLVGQAIKRRAGRKSQGQPFRQESSIGRQSVVLECNGRVDSKWLFSDGGR